ncbi:Chemotaxis sensory transducer [uncultured Alphaproteobacteria bacterium]|uniref:Chemotaxis sensory transducer n=1 Tax=uncultured Alphaproteobacteria bacterium TaxID=91750 RepID=A0A212KMJ4_9PROT|nr:Chemotaxis sensory transducer [uncultured Alphaproteobacteria bacterium]
MARPTLPPTGRERTWPDHQIIVSKTDARGVITYANAVFCAVAGYTADELEGQSHNIIRHPDMPRAVFKLLWDTIAAGDEIFAYVVNQAKNGDHYWVFAHVTPSFDAAGRIVGYHSSRRVPRRDAVAKVVPLYRDLKAIEDRAASPKAGLDASVAALLAILEEKRIAYDEFVFSL